MTEIKFNEPCGGCGQKFASKRCFGCHHEAIDWNLSALPPVDGLEVVAWRYRVWNNSEWRYGNDYPPGSDSAEPLVTLSQASSVIAGLREEVERCHARLEIDHEWVVGDNDDSDLERREIPMEERTHQIDGIECRDATITELEREIERLTEERDEARKSLRTVQNAAKTLSTCRDTELEHLRQNAKYDHQLRAEHESLMERDAQMTEMLLAAEARISSLEERNKRLREALGRIAKDEINTAFGLWPSRGAKIARQTLEQTNG